MRSQAPREHRVPIDLEVMRRDRRGQVGPLRDDEVDGDKLGLRLALDRSAPEWGVRLIFFRTGGLTVEIAHRLGQGEDAAGPDNFWGLTWRVGDIEAAHGRLAGRGFNVSDVRTGRRAGTRVFTVRDGTMGVPTLFISGGVD